MMPEPEVFDAAELSQIMGTSVQAIRSAIHSGKEGVSIPPSIKLGRRRRWLRQVVYGWLREKAKVLGQVDQYITNFHSGSMPFLQESKSMSAELPKLFRGQIYAASDGDEFTIMDLDPKNGRVVVEAAEGHQGLMNLEDMFAAIRSGELVCVDDEAKETEDAEKTD